MSKPKLCLILKTQAMARKSRPDAARAHGLLIRNIWPIRMIAQRIANPATAASAMRDLVLLAFIGAILLMGLKRPFLWVLLYIYVDLVMPQKIGWGLITHLQLSLIVFCAAFGGYLFLDGKQGSRASVRQALIAAILLWCGITTLGAQFPDSAWDKWDWVWKALLFAAFLPLTLRTRLRIEAAALVVTLSLGAIIISGGLKTIGGGGGYDTLRLLVQENAGIYEGSIISTAAIAIIPIIIWLAREGTIFKPGWLVWSFAGALIFACLLIPVGTSARTGLVCIVVLGAVMMRTVRYRFLMAGAVGAALLVAIPFLPQSFVERMSTITGFSEDQSASTRIVVWKWTLEYVGEHPLGGGFDAYRANSFTYQMPQVSGTESNRTIDYIEVTDKERAYHSSYFEMLGEHGWPGLAMFLALHGLGLWQMEVLRRRYRKDDGGDARWIHTLANALQQGHVIYLVGAAFVGIAFQPFAFKIVGLQIALWTWVQVQEQRRAATDDRSRPPISASHSTSG